MRTSSCFIYRDEVYNRSEDNPNRGKAEVIIGKQRNGPTGKIDLAFLDKFTAFKELYKGETAQRAIIHQSRRDCPMNLPNISYPYYGSS